MHKKELKTILSNGFVKFSLLPILAIEVALLLLYFFIYTYILSENTSIHLEDAKRYNVAILKNTSDTINQTLSGISEFATILQKEHESLFEAQILDINTSSVQFDVAKNGVYYKTTKEGSSLYYSSKTSIGEKEKRKAILTEKMDTTFQSIVDTNPHIVAAYFNSYDNMNRLYPFIDKVYEQYGKHISMESYNFYYLADTEHNPNKTPVWTSAYLDPAGHGWMLSCIVPIYHNNFLEGVSGLDITIDDVVQNILNKKLPYDAQMFMVDKEGMILAMPQSIERLLNLKELKNHLYSSIITGTIVKPEKFNLFNNNNPFAIHLKKLIQNKMNMIEFNIKGKEYLSFQKTVPITDWKLIMLIEKNKVFISMIKLKEISKNVGYLTILFLIIFSLFLMFYLQKLSNKVSKSIVDPIKDLTAYTEQIETLNLDSTLMHCEINEINQLNRNFLKMANQLNEKTKKLIAKEQDLIKSNETLEIKVKKRTKEIEEKNKQLQELARRDHLTGLYNRTKLDEVLENQLNDAKRYHTIFGIIMIDIDAFKEINDNYGHPIGDIVLCEFSELLKEHSRKTDTVGRWGGEEFLMIVKNIDKETLLALGEKLRVAIDIHIFSTVKHITASFGVVVYESDDTVISITKRADGALYNAKNSGRNCVLLA